MYGLGTLIDVLAIIVGGIAGLTLSKKMPKTLQESLMLICGVIVLFVGMSGTLQELLRVTGSRLTTGSMLMCICCLCLGTVAGELLRIEEHIENIGGWLKEKTGSRDDSQFVNGFLTASVTLGVGAMAIVGALQDALSGNIDILITKSILDLIIVSIMTASMGKGCLFSFLSIGVIQGGVTLFARIISPVMTPEALANLSTVGNMMIFCVGLNLVWGKRIRTGNLLPSLIFAVLWAHLF